MQMFQVGGCVRDELLGVSSHDIDFTVVLEPVEGDPFLAMTNRLKMMGFKIFLESPEFLTVRAQFPNKMPDDYVGTFNPLKMEKTITADFVLARKEGSYSDGRRPDFVQVGTLHDDLARRDFTMNAIAKDSEGNYIDPFNGKEDIERRVIRAVGDPRERLTEDALRAVRAMRFAVTKRFSFDADLYRVMESIDIADLVHDISDERIQIEISKMFRHSTPRSLDVLSMFSHLTDAIFAGRVSLDATMKQKGRGK